jgi:hypothetical protein
MLVEVLIAGNVMIGPNLCQADLIYKNQLYTVEYKCPENGTLQRGSVGMLQSTKYLKL